MSLEIIDNHPVAITLVSIFFILLFMRWIFGSDSKQKPQPELFKPLLIACRDNNLPEVIALIAMRETDINTCTEEGMTGLHLATEKNHKAVVYLLLQHKKIDVNRPNKQGVTAVQLAAQHNHLGILHFLLQHPDTDVNQPAGQEMSPLFTAVKKGHNAAVYKLLKKRGGRYASMG